MKRAMNPVKLPSRVKFREFFITLELWVYVNLTSLVPSTQREMSESSWQYICTVNLYIFDDNLYIVGIKIKYCWYNELLYHTNILSWWILILSNLFHIYIFTYMWSRFNKGHFTNKDMQTPSPPLRSDHLDIKVVKCAKKNDGRKISYHIIHITFFKISQICRVDWNLPDAHFCMNDFFVWFLVFEI